MSSPRTIFTRTIDLKIHLYSFNTRYSLRRAAAVIAHSEAAKAALLKTFQLKPNRCHVIPHGDLSVGMGAPLDQALARRKLNLPAGKLCLMFGTISPYKGIDEILAFWSHNKPPAALAIIGRPILPEYVAQVTTLTNAADNIVTHFERLSDEELHHWLSAADCVIFNYRNIFTSGAASLTRSYGIPLLFPSRLQTVDLDEPSPLVFRYDSPEIDLAQKLDAALNAKPDYASAQPWRDMIHWDRVAEKTAAVYRSVLASAA